LNRFLIGFILILFTLQIKVVALTVDFTYTEVCLGDSTTFISLSVASPNDNIRDQWWDFTGDGRFNDRTGDTVTWLFDRGYQSVGLKVLTWGGEVSALYKLVPVGDVKADFHFSDGCSGQPVPFYDNSKVYGDEAASYTWNFGDGSSSNERNPIHTFLNTGDYKVIFSIITKIGCTDSLTDTIAIGQSPVLTLQFSGDTVFFAGDSVTVSTVETFDSIFWFPDGQTTSSITIYSGGSFKVKGWGGGCYNEKSFTTRIKEYEKNPIITTLFTPNSDGINDFWEILNLSTVMPCETTVYNRFGEKVLSESDYRNDWDGSFNGKILPNDTYYYFVRCYDNVLYKGTVNILK